MAAAVAARQLSEAVQGFALDGRFPDDVSSLPPVSETDLDPSIEALGNIRKDLEAEVHKINEETKEDVSSWVRNAKELQEDIIRSKAIANDIVRQSEAPDVSGEAIDEAEEKAEFLNREVQYSRQLYNVLRSIQHVDQLLGEVEQARNERRILDSLRLLEKSWGELDEIGLSRSCRIMKLLDLRTFELKSDVHKVFNEIWKDIIEVDIDAGKIAIHSSLNEQQMGLPEAVIGLKAYKEVDERMEQLWRNIDAAILTPRMKSGTHSVSSILAQGDILELQGQSENSVAGLLKDLDTATSFLSQRVPSELLQSLSRFMMSDLIPRLVQQWLDPAVPTSLKNMDEFQVMIQGAESLCGSLEQQGFSGFEDLSQWAAKAPTIWLEKCRESTLNSVRSRLTRGVGQPKQVEKVEKHMVSVAEGKELATTGAGATAETNDWGDEWGDAWDEDNNDADAEPLEEKQPDTAPSGGEDDGADAWGWDEDDSVAKPAEDQDHPMTTEADDEDDSAAAWGWGDENNEQEPQGESPKRKRQPQHSQPAAAPAQEQTRELILKETYHISSMPEPVLELIFAVLEDGARLTQPGDEFAHVASTAPGLFSMPTFVLALFRAISPYYYSLDVGGNMYLYNDAMYLAEKLGEFSVSWKEREDLTPRARAMLRLDNDVKSLQSFANRSYASEMNIQRTVLRDLLGGGQSILQHDEMESAVESGVARIRSMAATWESILARSVWSQAIGSLADALATKLITDVLEMSSIGQDEAYNIAKIIAAATELDDLFLPSKLAGSSAPAAQPPSQEDEVPATAQYAPNWLRLKYLSEVLQSNLNEVRYLWVESELSLYFTVEEVVDLIRASFEENARTKETIREIQSKPRPLD